MVRQGKRRYSATVEPSICKCIYGAIGPDIYLLFNDNIRINLDNDGNDVDSDFEIYNDGILLFKVDESGDITSGGTGIASFRRPAYNSGWIALGLNATTTLTHGIGGNIDNYVVDLTCKSNGATGVNNWSVAYFPWSLFVPAITGQGR